MSVSPELGGEILSAYWKAPCPKPISANQHMTLVTDGKEQVALIPAGDSFAVVSIVDGSLPAVLPFVEATHFAETYVSEMYEGPAAK